MWQNTALYLNCKALQKKKKKIKQVLLEEIYMWLKKGKASSNTNEEIEKEQEDSLCDKTFVK